MGKSISVGLTTHIESDVTSLAQCVKIERTDGDMLGFTSHDADIVYDGVTYQADSAVDPTAIQQGSALEVPNLELTGLIDSDSLTEADLRSGKYDGAEIRIFLLNWQDTSQGPLKLLRGWLGEVKLFRGIYSVEVRGLMDALQDNLLRRYTPDCPWDLGDSNCGVDLTSVTQSGTVGTVTDNRTFTAAGLTISADDEFNGGVLTWTSGDNSGGVAEVKDSTLAGVITLYLKQPQDISVGDGFDIHPGCNKSLSECKDTYDNVLSFGGFPHVPNRDEIIDVSE